MSHHSDELGRNPLGIDNGLRPLILQLLEQALEQIPVHLEYLDPAADVLDCGRIAAPWFNEATIQALEDAHAQAGVALERARESETSARGGLDWH